MILRFAVCALNVHAFNLVAPLYATVNGTFYVFGGVTSGNGSNMVSDMLYSVSTTQQWDGRNVPWQQTATGKGSFNGAAAGASHLFAGRGAIVT